MADSRVARLAGPVLVGVGIATAIVFTLLFPAVEGLGTKVRLPVFHGAMTWVNLVLFVALALCGIAYLATKRDALYAWAEALRWVSIPMWVLGSALGLMAALNTWDFTGSKASPFAVASADPRLNAQFWIVLAALGLLALALVVEDRRLLALGDVAFVTGTWVLLLRAMLGPGRALHPDSPVMNSDEVYIKLMFLGIVAGIALASLGAVLIVRRSRARVATALSPAVSEV